MAVYCFEFFGSSETGYAVLIHLVPDVYQCSVVCGHLRPGLEEFDETFVEDSLSEAHG